VPSSAVMLLEPFGFLELVKLSRHARLVLSDNGALREDCGIMRVPKRGAARPHGAFTNDRMRR
jgi:UDP-N-acetylglucosamine 2-epimerase